MGNIRNEEMREIFVRILYKHDQTRFNIKILSFSLLQ